MSEKIKVSGEVAEALNEIRAYHEPLIDDFMKRHAEGKSSSMFSVLDKFRTVYIGHLIYSGDYELEETPEEKLLARFNYCDKRWGWHQHDEIEMRATAIAIKETLEILNIKIKGINE